VDIYCDCLGAIKKARDNTLCRIPTHSKHADILKILQDVALPSAVAVSYHHVTAHQDDSTPFEMLPRAVQLNCECDYTAETHLLEHLDTPTDRMFPREKVAIFIGQRRLTTDTSRWIRHHIGKQLARQFYMSKKILSGSQFDRVDLVHIADTLQSLPKLFQLWAAKHVSRVAGTMAYLHYQTGCSPLCPSCLSAQETTSHITRCPEAGRQKALEASITNLTSWLTASHTDPLLREAIVSYLQQRGAVSLTELLEGYPRAGRGSGQPRVGQLHDGHGDKGIPAPTGFTSRCK